MKRKLVVLLLAGALLGCNQSEVSANNSGDKNAETQKVEQKVNGENVLKRVGNEVITKDDLEQELSNMPDQYKKYYETEQGRVQLLERLTEQKILKQVALEQGIDENEEYLEELDKVKENLLAKYVVQVNVLDNIEASDEELKAFYEENKDKYKSEEEATASHILIKSDTENAESKAKDVLKKAQEDGADFAKLAKEYSEGPSADNGGSLGTFGKGKMVPEFEKAVFGDAKAGEVYPELVKTQFGYHIVKVDDKNQSGFKKFDQVKSQIEEDVLNEKKQSKYQEFMEEKKAQYLDEEKDENKEEKKMEENK
ncbi:MAG: peptidylprolyl isomerase [Fusobacteriota bacterium]